MLQTTKKQDINTKFLQEWQPFNTKYLKAKQAIRKHFAANVYTWQPTHEESSKKPFKPHSFAQINETLGFAYTSTSAYAGLWVCNAGYLWADNTHYFTGFAINTDNQVVGIAHDFDENEIFILL